MQKRVIILGTGISASILATILNKHGIEVQMLEAKVHPRFAIGESTIPQTSAMLRLLALKYDVPELLAFSSFTNLQKITNTSGVKRQFGFIYHQEGKEVDHNYILQSVIPDLPHGPECHWFRQDVDYLALQVALKYGAKVDQNIKVKDIEIDANQVVVTSASGQTFEGDYLVDCAGYNSPIAHRQGLRETNPDLETNSRAIFNHFFNVQPFDKILPSRGVVPRLWVQGTVHHLFSGGWFWVIPFNNTKYSKNSLCSIGLCLDRRVYPETDSTPDEEFWAIVNKFPSIKKHLSDAIPTRPWVKTGRMQYSSQQVVGNRFCLMTHSAGFIDPLFSRGLATTMETIDLLAQKLIDTNSDQWFSKETFQAVEDYQLASLRYTDALVSTAYQSLADYWSWNAMFRVWLTGVTLGAFSLNRNLNKFAETGNKNYLNLGYEHISYPGFISPDQKEFYSLFELAKESIFNSSSSHKEDKQCFEDICHQLQESNFLPPEFKISDPELKCPAKYDLATFFQVIQWGKKRAPNTIKNNYFDFGPLPFIKALWTERNKSHLLKL